MSFQTLYYDLSKKILTLGTSGVDRRRTFSLNGSLTGPRVKKV